MAFLYSAIILTGGLVVAYFLFQNEVNVYRISKADGHVTVVRGRESKVISKKDLVPGDVIKVESGTVFADMILIKSKNVIVDELALTGESTPVAKTAIDRAERSSRYSYQSHKRHTISAGTTVTEASDVDLALVLKTGSYTAKGELFMDILAFKRHSFKFDTEVKNVLYEGTSLDRWFYVGLMTSIANYATYEWQVWPPLIEFDDHLAWVMEI